MINLNICLESVFSLKYKEFTQTHCRLIFTFGTVLMRHPKSHLHYFIPILLFESAESYFISVLSKLPIVNDESNPTKEI